MGESFFFLDESFKIFNQGFIIESFELNQIHVLSPSQINCWKESTTAFLHQEFVPQGPITKDFFKNVKTTWFKNKYYAVAVMGIPNTPVIIHSNIFRSDFKMPSIFIF